jgi:hypothetical protein
MVDVRGGHMGTSAFVPFVIPRWWWGGAMVLFFRVLWCVGKGHEQVSQVRSNKQEVSRTRLFGWRRH